MLTPCLGEAGLDLWYLNPRLQAEVECRPHLSQVRGIHDQDDVDAGAHADGNANLGLVHLKSRRLELNLGRATEAWNVRT